MSYSFYDASITPAAKALASLSHILKKGEAAPNAASLPEARIHPDMKDLIFQVYFVTDTISKLVSRLTGTEPAVFENNLVTFADFQARIAQVQEIVSKADKELVNKRQTEVVPLGLGPNKPLIQIASVGYVSGYALPNIYFHLVTAYDILRKEGVPLGKVDYSGAFLQEYLQ